MNDRWFVAQTHPRAEWTAQMRLKGQGFDVFLPAYEETRKVARQMALTLAPLFPGYLFVGFDPLNPRWRAIGNTRGVLRLLCSCQENPVPVPRGVIEALQSQANSDGLLAIEDSPTPSDLLAPGDRLRITEGPFAGFVGVCIEDMISGRSSERRVRLMLDMLRRPLPIELRRGQVEAVA